ncbi:hypothetical protein GCM10007079_03810 [Nocardiopsis terrae]|uniref:SPW repeat-containing protein n=1 Tax=Nocardiopsis terrae TaxID=372655 RepID=A0ABR9HN24_9ACTN|nr:hypothetical protein [Nocardiopsis terrae]MBE1460432.1 hypothetical protein [Nocardiopsis terrae]GHC71438.1 hypothetical protein GCM10007079_03810 [Nocardiopsis terrae]
MRKFLQGLGALITLMGVSGAVDHLWTQPILGVVLNAFNRLVVRNVAVLQENALLANLGLAVCGVVLVVAAEASPSARRRA